MEFLLGKEGNENMRENGNSGFSEWDWSIIRVGKDKEWARKKKWSLKSGIVETKKREK